MAVGNQDLDPSLPVLIGVGSCFDDVEAVDMMARATLEAGADCGAPELLRRVDRIVVPRGTWSYADPARLVAERIGSLDATTVLVDVGIPQQEIINDVLSALRAGEIEVAVVTGAEAKARSARLRAASTKGDAAGMVSVMSGGTSEALATETDQGDAAPDIHQQPLGDLIDPAELAAGLYAPVDQYALIESALAAAEGLSIEEMGRDVALLWERFNAVGRSNPHAAFPQLMSAADLATPSATNRPLAFPYTKWLVSQWTVDQGASLLFTTVGVAQRAGIDPSRWVHPLVGLTSSDTVPLTQRAERHRWPAMEVLGAAAENRLGHPLDECAMHEIYSCFPVAVRVQQRELGLALDATPTVTGGMTFAGGPFNSFVLQSLAPIAHRLRNEGGEALVTSVSGLLTKPGLGVWAAANDGRPPLLADLGAQAAEAASRRIVLDRLDGHATIEAATVVFDDLDPTELVALLANDAGEVAIARSADGELILRAMSGRGVVGTDVDVVDNLIVG